MKISNGLLSSQSLWIYFEIVQTILRISAVKMKAKDIVINYTMKMQVEILLGLQYVKNPYEVKHANISEYR